MSRFYLFLILLFSTCFSLSEDNQPVLDVPESSTDTAVDIQVPSPTGQLPPGTAEAEVLLDNAPPTKLDTVEGLEVTEGVVQTAEEAEQPKDTQEEVEQAEAVPAGEESEEVRALRLKIRAYTPDYKYTIEDKKDPFSKPGALKDITTLPEDRLHPVEQASIDNIQLRAIIWGRDGVVPRALFEVQNKTYTLTENDRLGQEGALIARIETDRIWAMKPVTDPATGLVRFEPYEKTLSTAAAGSAAKGMELFYER
ncbi:MAG: hypothetical protein OXK80_02195 [Bdellovibrionales bacterium]|nr:hypothetical protein [Bdellovibrionales bacterium]